MKIEFPIREATLSETGGINFPAIVDGNQITCKVTQEALQDIAPENSADQVEKQFSKNRSTFENIARSKIKDANSDILITSSDIN